MTRASLGVRVPIEPSHIVSPVRQAHIRAGFGSGFLVGLLGGLIGLGGAEYRLPLLIGYFGFDSLPAVILNKATSIVVVASSILFRARSVPLTELLGRGGIILTLLS